MIDISTQYMGLRLRNPIIAGSSGLTSKIDQIIELDRKGIGAVVLKSIFEEQINVQAHHLFKQASSFDYSEAYDYIINYSSSRAVDEYLNLIQQAKNQASIPIIASINCYSLSEWTSYVKKVEQAGADGIELNIFILPSDPNLLSAEIEKQYFNVIDRVLEQTSIPLSIKLGYYFTDLARFVTQLSWKKIKGIVLFNRTYSPDIDIESMKVIAAHPFSTSQEATIPLRWIALLSERVQCDFCASTGVHTYEDVIKLLLAGAKAVQIVSAFYQKGSDIIPEILKGIEEWMKRHGFSKLNDFRGKLSYHSTINPAAYERIQFMKYFSNIE
ncbi:MAG: dihydroorotate dehydrogenase-like protein [Bacteroidales bacterium]|nr:dihydroorotate dehydrogenase-like protein [Bacteroidales bacterium]